MKRAFSHPAGACGLLLSLAAGCAAATAVDAAPSFEVAVTLERITVLGICEEVLTDIDGGEFSYTLFVEWPDGSRTTIGATENYPSAASYIQAKAGSGLTLPLPTRRRTLTPAAGASVRVVFRATEWDWDLFGNNPFPDSRMNDRSTAATSTYEDSGNWTIGQGAMNLRHSDACHLRANVGVVITPA